MPRAGDPRGRRDARHGAHPRARDRDVLHDVPARAGRRQAHIQVCGTTPCMLRGADDLKRVLSSGIHHDRLHLPPTATSRWEEVECLGACVNAPMVPDLNADTLRGPDRRELQRGCSTILPPAPVKPGPQIDRQFSAPVGRADDAQGGDLSSARAQRSSPITPPPAPESLTASSSVPGVATWPRAFIGLLQRSPERLRRNRARG